MFLADGVGDKTIPKEYPVMSFLKRLVPVKAKVWISLDKPQFTEGEPVVGKVNIEAKEYLQASEIRVEARVFEHWTEPVWVVQNNVRVQTMQRKSNTLFSRDTQVSGQTDVGSGPVRSFPFAVAMPACRPTQRGGTIENSVKGVIAVKGRPDATGSTNIAFAPPSAYPMMGPQMQPVGYGPSQGYGGYPQGPMPGYGAPAYNMPPQAPPVVTREVVKVRCKYCQTLMDMTSPVCPNCGGHQ